MTHKGIGLKKKIIRAFSHNKVFLFFLLLTILALIGIIILVRQIQIFNQFAVEPTFSGLHVSDTEPTFSELHVSGNELVNNRGQQVVLHGVDKSDTAYSCVQGKGIFVSPVNQTSVNTMKTWNINAVRIPLNEDCWLNINGVPSRYGGTTYRQAIINYVNLLNQNGIYAIVDLHWNAPGTTLAKGQQRMADKDHSPTFWTSVAHTFKGNNAVLFDLYNEPQGISWSCWKNGGSCGSFPIAGMQELVNTVRATGATNVLMLGGLAYSNDLSSWLANEPSDTLNPPQIAASWHVYNYNRCNNTICYNHIIAPIAAQVPIIVGEMGENDCADGFINSLMPWLDQHKISYLAWSWNVTSCSSPSLITDNSGTPSKFGVGFKNHLLSFPTNLYLSPVATVTSTPPSTPIPTSQPSPAPASPSATVCSNSTNGACLQSTGSEVQNATSWTSSI